MSERTEKLLEAFAGLDRGDLAPFESLFTAGAQWLGLPGSGFDGTTPT